MKSILRFLRTFRILVSHWEWVDEPEWTKEDAKAFEAFLRTPTGEKLAAQLRSIVLQSQKAAVCQQANHAYECGFAAGQTHLVAQVSVLGASDNFTATGDGTDPETS